MTSIIDVTLNSFVQSGSTNENVAIQSNLSEHSQVVFQNTSLRTDCIKIVFSEMEFLPWDNPDNLVSAEVEEIVSRIKSNVLVLLFLIGGPANVINMAVFYNQGLNDRVNLCLFALSLADELHLFNSALHFGEQVYLQFTTKEPFGPVSTILSNNNLGGLLGFYYVSYVLSAIAATERCLCVYDPLRFQTLLSTKAMAVIVIVVFIVVLGLFFTVSVRYRVGCVHDPVANVIVMTGIEGEFYKAHKEFIDALESSIFGFGLPGVVMIVVMTTTMMTIVRLRQVVRWRSETSSAISARELAVTKMLVANSVFFIACLTPVIVNRTSWLFFPDINSGGRHYNVFLIGLWSGQMFSYINATFNFFVYYSMGSRYRETLWGLFGRKTPPKKH
ncbi:uncharacterized protein LOC143282434 [Babylonia areolata]|uniref:uncharacterized protein LOC143282434 n=1 Tax=Babylonia areolata TaxID=304850 RepID=UPI003FCFF81F